MLGFKLYRQIIGIPMGTNCAPRVADLFLFCYERDLMNKKVREKSREYDNHKKGIRKKRSPSKTPRGRGNRQTQTSTTRTNVRKALRLALSSPSQVIAILKGLNNTRTKWHTVRPVVYSTDRSKAVVPVLVLLFVALWFILRGDLLYVLLCVILFLFFFSVLLVLRLHRLGKREIILVLFVRLFDLCLFGFVVFLFLLVSGKGCGLWLWHSLDFSLTFFLYNKSPRRINHKATKSKTNTGTTALERSVGQ